MKVVPLLVVLGGAVGKQCSGIYRWGPRHEHEEEELLYRDPGNSMIYLDSEDGVLEIVEVARGDYWTYNRSFCTLMLAPTIRHFLQVTDCPSPSLIKVHNTARPVMAGCLCYTRSLAQLGFARINGVDFSSDMCETHLSHGWFLADRTSEDMGESTPYQKDLVENEARKDIEVFNF